jgi:NAD(P)H-dependent FMN reductase
MDADRSDEGVRILLISGSTRAGSTNTAALRAAQDASCEGLTAVLYDGMAELPAFNPDDDYDPLPAPVVALRAQIAAADGVLFCTPEYAGALPGSFKNLLDWTVGGPEMDGKPVAWLSVASEGRGVHAERSLETVLGYLSTTVTEVAGRRVFVPRDAVDADGEISDVAIREAIVQTVREFADQAARASS